MNEIQGVRMIFIGWYVIDLRGSCAKYTLDDTGFRHTLDRGEKPERRGGWMDIERISNVRKCNRRNVFRHGQIYNLCNRDLLTYLLTCCKKRMETRDIRRNKHVVMQDFTDARIAGTSVNHR